jgi:hypothetical protein
MEPAGNRGLVKSIRSIRLQYPLLVISRGNGKFMIIDGHRRYSVLKADGHESAPCIVAEGNSAQLYSDVNATARPLDGRDWAIIFITGGSVPPGRTRNNLIKLSQLIGNAEIGKMAEAGMKPGVIQTARAVSKYVYQEEDDDKLRTIVQWLIRYRQSPNCNGIITNQQDPLLIREALEEDRKIKIGLGFLASGCGVPVVVVHGGNSAGSAGLAGQGILVSDPGNRGGSGRDDQRGA